MADVQQLAPQQRHLDAEMLVAELREHQHQLTPFNDQIVAFAADLARRLRRHPAVRDHPAIGALAWWIRPASIEQLRGHWDYLCGVPDIIRTPRGVVFHLPPTNVDTMFVYSWLLSALAGNANIIRLSTTASDNTGPMLDTINAALNDHQTIADTTAIVTYGHDREITAGLSTADMRVIWGGDHTINTIRQIPLAPRATELAFPDRYSYTIIDSQAVLKHTSEGLDQLIAHFINDAYWFDQLGCASPRLIIWHGAPHLTQPASERFHTHLIKQLALRQQATATSTVIAKLVHTSATAADGTTTSINWTNNSATFAEIEHLARIPRDSPGGGLFYQTQINDVTELPVHIQPRDQTLTHHGLTRSELTQLAHSVGSRGIDRIIPIGQALNFHHNWDGYDLLQQFSRGVHLVVDERATE